MKFEVSLVCLLVFGSSQLAISFPNNLLSNDEILALLPHSVRASVEIIGTVGPKVYFKNASDEHAQFIDAMEFCQEMEMQPASISSDAENQLVASYLDTTPSNVWFWLGAWDIGHEGKFTWIESGDELTYTSWQEGYPSRGTKGNCVLINKFGTWFDNTCIGDTNAALCQKTF